MNVQGDNAGVLGTGLDELMRHVPALREDCIRVVLEIFRTLARQGGASESLLRELGGAPAASPPAADAAEPMEAEAAGTSADTGPSRDPSRDTSRDVEMGTGVHAVPLIVQCSEPAAYWRMR